MIGRQLPIEAAAPALRALADAVLIHCPTPAPIEATPFVWREPASIPSRGSINLNGLASDPVGTACLAEARRIGTWLASYGTETMEAAHEAATADEPRRADIIGTAWAGLPGWHA